MKLEQKVKELLKEKEVTDYKWIDPKEIVVAQWVRVKCTFGCSDYGLATCPPNTPDVEACKSFFSEYSIGLVIRFNKKADRKQYPTEWSKKATALLLNAEREIFKMGNHKVFLFNQTCCGICKECTGSRLNCIDKTNSRPSPEAFAVDVYQTVRKYDMPINVVSTSPGEMNRYAFILVD